ncbi:TPA: hypothetical protein KX620_001671 [Escherichia coli]|nr:hypothetical protein [Escherichia coli]
MSRNTEATDDVKTWTGGPLNYKEGFFTQLATDELAKGINEHKNSSPSVLNTASDKE